jgi:Seven in absentia protein family
MSDADAPEVPHEQEASTSPALNNIPQTDPVAFRFLSDAGVDHTVRQNLSFTPQLGAQSDPPGIIPIAELTDSNVEATTLLTEELDSSGTNVQPYGMYHGLLPTRATALGSGIMLSQGARLQLMIHQNPTSDPVTNNVSSSENNIATRGHQPLQSGNASDVDNVSTPNNQMYQTSDDVSTADSSLNANHQQPPDIPPSNPSDQQQQEYNRRREEQRQLLLAAAQRRAAMTAASMQHSSDSTQPLGDAESQPSATPTLSLSGATREDPPPSSVGTPIFATLQERDLQQSNISNLMLPSIVTQPMPSPLMQQTVGLRSNRGTESITIEQNLQGEQRQQGIPSSSENTTNTTNNVESGRNSERMSIREGISILHNIAGRSPQVLMSQQRGTPHRTIRIPPGARQFTVPVGIGTHIHIQGSIANNPVQDMTNNPNTIPRVPLTPLEAQAIPYVRPNDVTENMEGGGSDAEDDQYDKYRCTICYEFLANPSSCGKCSSRFCYACLVRVATTNNSTTVAAVPPNLNQVSKCPGCRTLLMVEGIVRDTALQEELRAANLQVLCGYPGCGQRLPAASVKEHELTCEYTPLRCKNSTLGCTWNGVRKNLAHHLSHHCPLERVAGLVEQFRQNRADHQSAILALQRGQSMSSQLTQVNSDLVRRLLPSPTNIFDLVNLAYTASCTTPYFLYSSDVWRSFLGPPGAAESRAMLSNLLYLLPTIFNVCRVRAGNLMSSGFSSMNLTSLSFRPQLEDTDYCSHWAQIKIFKLGRLVWSWEPYQLLLSSF